MLLLLLLFNLLVLLALLAGFLVHDLIDKIFPAFSTSLDFLSTVVVPICPCRAQWKQYRLERGLSLFSS